MQEADLEEALKVTNTLSTDNSFDSDTSFYSFKPKNFYNLKKPSLFSAKSKSSKKIKKCVHFAANLVWSRNKKRIKYDDSV